MPEIPRSESDFTVDWMNEVLAPHLGDCRVTECKARMSDIPGQTAEVVLVDVEYSDTTDLPARLVAKVTSQNPDVIEHVINHYDQYRRETSFYREFPDIGISVPRCLHEAHNPETQEFVILMADLAPAECPSWAIEPEQVEASVNALPAFHAKWWNDHDLRSKDWMVQFDDHDFYRAAATAADSAAPTFREHYDDAELTVAIMAYMKENLGQLMKHVASRPFTFVHGDYHAKQMFFPTDAGGEFAVIDWQFPFVAPGPWDLARMTGMCLETTERQRRESAFMDNYLAGLEAAGVTYTRAELEEDYRFGLLVSQMIMSVAHADTDMEIVKKECAELGVDWQDAMLYRTQHALDEWQVLDFLKSI